MKKYIIILIALILTAGTFSSCDDLMNAESNRLTSDSNYGLSTASDSVYSLVGLFTQLQKVADSYILLGELRGDLMDVTATSDLDLRDIENFEIKSGNSYVNIKDYYAIINNCNYIISHLDTNRVDMGQRLSIRHYAAAKSIRAWTYLQIVTNFKTAKYYTKPILSIDDANKNYPELDFDQISDSLIKDLEPIASVQNPNLGYIDSYNSVLSFFPVQFVLGDLYLWKGEYQKAATAYRNLMYDKKILIDKSNMSSWLAINNTISSTGNLYWQRSFTASANELITCIACPTEYGQTFRIDSLNNQRRITASGVALKKWASEIYFLNDASNAFGDLRKFGSISYNDATNKEMTSDYSYNGAETKNFLIYKYKMYKQNIVVYRSALLYLRYAEAVNRLNKPNLALAVLRNGLNSTTMSSIAIIPEKERESPIPTYMNFGDFRFNNNVGIRMRGLGNADKDTTYYVLPEMNDQLDSVRYVENLIQNELALETAFEGNRFTDLMRITYRRMKDGDRADDASYLADKIAAKFANPTAIKAKLMNTENWYIKR